MSSGFGRGGAGWGLPQQREGEVTAIGTGLYTRVSTLLSPGWTIDVTWFEQDFRLRVPAGEENSLARLN